LENTTHSKTRTMPGGDPSETHAAPGAISSGTLAPHVMYNAYTVHGFPSEDHGVIHTPRETTIGVERVAANSQSYYPMSHVKYFPLGSAASYIRTVPHYELMSFVCVFGDKWVVGWYYKRRLESTPHVRDRDWKNLWNQDTRINTDILVLRARDDRGEFIRGKVWLAMFGFPHPVSRVYDPYTSVPVCVIHAKGWDIPSWALTPVARLVNPDILTRRPHAVPAYKELLRLARAEQRLEADLKHFERFNKEMRELAQRTTPPQAALETNG